MASEKEKMLAGELYNPFDPQLVRERNRARTLCRRYAAARPTAAKKKARILAELIGTGGVSTLR